MEIMREAARDSAEGKATNVVCATMRVALMGEPSSAPATERGCLCAIMAETGKQMIESAFTETAKSAFERYAARVIGCAASSATSAVGACTSASERVRTGRRRGKHRRTGVRRARADA